MCGIFGYAGYRKNAAQIVLDGLKTLEYRGYDSWGIAVVPENNQLKTEDRGRKTAKHNPDNVNIVIKKKTGKIGTADVDDLPEGSIAFGHTRWATHGGVTQINAHPHLDCSGNLAIIHNGIIENYLTLKKKLDKLGHKIISDTDSEIAVHLIEQYSQKSILSKAFQRSFNEITGLNAFIVLSALEKRLVAGRTGSPLVVGYGDGESFIASDAAAILPYTRQVYFLEDNQMAILSRAGIMIFEAGTGELIEIHKQHLNYSIEQTVKGNYPFFMLKEINEQPAIISAITATDTTPAEKIATLIQSSQGTYMVGCGTAAHACMCGSYLFSKIANRHVNWAIGSEFSYQLEFLTGKSLVIAMSQSGETMDTLESVKKAKSKGAKIFALVNSIGSSLYRMADAKLLVGAGPEISVASTKAFTGKLAHLILLSYALSGKITEGQKVLIQAVKSLKQVLSKESQANIIKLAEILKNREDMFIIGRGLSYPAALETALKIKEIAYIHAEGLAAGELKHGPLALVEQGTPCLAYLPHDETFEANFAGAQEMKARGGYIIGVSSKPHELFDYFIPVSDAGVGTIIPNVAVGQLLAYYLAISKKLDPDKPRNLAKSVTVK
jgi:glucosamine--fructose-6-phosphate aminotransferase (isomerizing)